MKKGFISIALLFLILAAHVPAVLAQTAVLDQAAEMETEEVKASKFELLDTYLSSLENPNGNQVRKAVLAVFDIDLDLMSKNNEGILTYSEDVLRVVREELGIDPQTTDLDDKIYNKSKSQIMDIYIHTLNGNVSIGDVQTVVYGVYGVNLAGISTLEHARFSVYSKGGWVVKKDTDIFVVESGIGDIDLYIYPTEYFIAKTGINGVPEDFQEQLKQIGMSYDDEAGRMYYHTPNNQSMSADFKDAMMAIVLSYTSENFLDI